MDFFVQAVNGITDFGYGSRSRTWSMGSLINLMEGYGNDNPGAKSQGI